MKYNEGNKGKGGWLCTYLCPRIMPGNTCGVESGGKPAPLGHVCTPFALDVLEALDEFLDNCNNDPKNIAALKELGGLGLLPIMLGDNDDDDEG